MSASVESASRRNGAALPPADDRVSVALPPAFVEAVAVRVAEILADRHSAEPEPWMGVEAASAHLACGHSRVYALVSAGRIPHRKDGSRLLFRASELDAWLASGGGIRP